jgi:hypothetical protein
MMVQIRKTRPAICVHCGAAYAARTDSKGLFCSVLCVRRWSLARLAIQRTKTVADQLAHYTDKRGVDECWPFMGTKSAYGYGVLHAERRKEYAHRAAYRLSFGEIPNGLLVRHGCDNPVCVNPNHLSVGTKLDNVRDMVDRDRNNYGERVTTSKLKAADIPIIFGRREKGDTYQAIGRDFGVSSTTIGQICRGDRWRREGLRYGLPHSSNPLGME